MPANMRLHTRPPGHEFPVDDTPPSTRPSSAASTSSTPNRSTSMDSLHTNSSASDKPSGEEFIPTRIIRAAPKVNANAMQFVKTGPASLHKSAKEQMKKAEVVKSLRKTSLQEEEEWQSNCPSSNPPPLEESSDWQANLDKWKSSRRKRNEDVLERVIEVKKYEKEEEYTKGRRKSKTFSEMREDKDKRGRRYNLVVHDTDNDDLSELGLNSGGKPDGSSSLSDAAEDAEPKDLFCDNKDAKSDAGFCTGSDTGSDGVFAEDNISDTSSALGDKKDAHDSLLDPGLPLNSKDSSESLLMNGHVSLTSSMSLTSSHHNSEYTYDKAIEEYKQFAENSAKKRTPSVNSLCSNTSLSKEDEKTMYKSQDLSKKMDDKLSFFHREMDQDLKARVKEPRVIRREKNLKVDINKRRSMFELRDIDNETHEQKQINRRSVDVSNKLKTKVMSFENISESDKRTRAVTPQRDTKFKEKLANFSQHGNQGSPTVTPSKKKTPERDQNFYKKLQSFTRMESEEVTSKSISRTTNSSPKKPISIGTRDNKFPTWRSPERKNSSEVGRERTSVRSGMPLKERIASFENLSPADEISRTREKSVSMECLNKPLLTDDFKPLNSSISVSNLYRRTPSTPFMVVEVDENVESDETCMKSRVSRSYLSSSTAVERNEHISSKHTYSSEDVSKRSVFTSDREDDIPPLGPPPKVPTFSSSVSSKAINSQRRASPSPTRISPSVQKSFSPARRSPSPSLNRVPLSPTKSSPPTILRGSASPTRNSSLASLNRVSVSPTRRTSPPKVPDSPPPAPPPPAPDSPPNGFSPLTPDIAPEIPKCAPPSFSLQQRTQSYSSSTIERMSQELEEFEPQDSIDDMSHLQEYGDDDIDEVIDNYEHLSESVTGEELPQNHFYESALDMGSLPSDQLSKDLYEENMYERIQDEEPVYENIYEKVLDVDAVEVLDSLEGSLEHQYQTLEEVKTEVENLVSPPLPPKNFSSSAFEERQSRSTTSTKQELRQKMSDFLGTQPQLQEELTLKPPPDVNEILRQERVEERMIVQKQQNLSREVPLMDFDPLLPQPYRPRYTWEDRMRDDSVRPQDLNESSDQMNFQLKLEELEQEMVKHDREMLQRVKSGTSLEEKSKDQNGQTFTDSKISLPNTNQTVQEDYHPHLPMENNLSSGSTEENSYTHSNIPPPSQYSEFARGIPSNQPIYSEAFYEEESGSISSRTLRQHSSSTSQAELPANLPLQEFYKTPILDERLSRDSNIVDYQENISYEEDFNSVQEKHFRNEIGGTTETQPRKQSILALSAIPKPRLTDNDSWIMKKKADACKKDYNKHWLFQEAEQRRLEQQDRISRVKPTLTESTSLNKLSNNTLPTTSSYQSHFQNVKSNFNQTSKANYSYNVANGGHSPSNVYNSSNVSNVSPSPYSSPNSSSSNIMKPSAGIQPSSSSSNFNASYATSGQSFIPNGTTNGSNNNWMKQTKTYQPEIPLPTTTSSKPLPDSIINTLTQRVNNKNKNIPSSRTPVYKSNYRDDNYHDYMNTEFNSPSSNASPTIPQGGIPQGGVPPSQSSSAAPEDQRLLSVSGKKKCSHCGEELGRGAAMIIESLRLFYHIPCFKCCVCGIQLGNGTSGADVRVRNHKLHCHNCYSNDEGMKFSKV